MTEEELQKLYLQFKDYPYSDESVELVATNKQLKDILRYALIGEWYERISKELDKECGSCTDCKGGNCCE